MFVSCSCIRIFFLSEFRPLGLYLNLTNCQHESAVCQKRDSKSNHCRINRQHPNFINSPLFPSDKIKKLANTLIIFNNSSLS